MINRYRGNCHYCGGTVAPKAGSCFRVGPMWKVAHLACKAEDSPQVTTVYFPSTGNTMTQNARGRCEDAPCCGCCTF